MKRYEVIKTMSFEEMEEMFVNLYSPFYGGDKEAEEKIRAVVCEFLNTDVKGAKNEEG